MNLETLVIKFQQKDIAAYEKLYEMYSDSIFGVILNIVKKEDIAEEILQDVFVKIWNNAKSYNASKGRFFTWILNIARNASIDYTRSKAYKKNKENQNSDYFVDILETNENLDAQTNTIGLRKFVKELSEKCKSVIEFLYFKGYTQKEASEELDIPLGTIKTRNRQCLEQLRINLGV